MVVLAVAVLGLLLGGRAAYLSFADGERFEALAFEQNTETSWQSTRDRGDVLSADGRKLATSLEAAKIVATPYLIETPEKAAARISEALGSETDYTTGEIEELLTKRDGDGDLLGYSVIGEEVDPKAADRIEALNIPGVSTSPDAVRVYPEGEVAGQLVGHLGDYGEPFGGVETRYDEALRSGEGVSLTVDSAVQEQLEHSIQAAAEKYKANNALGLVMRVDNGEIVALANSPGYDNNHYNEASPEEQRNRVITDVYEPGSTFKAFTMSAAFEEDAVTQDTRFTVPDHVTVADTMISDSLPHKTHVMTPEEILQESSNVGTIKVARKVGGKNIEEYAQRFGFGEPTGVDLWGEAAGTLPAYEDWSGTSIGNIPIGQGVAMTPLQLAAGYSVIANGGYQITPHVAQEFPGDGRKDRVISADTSSIVKGMLQSVVEKGTGIYAHIPGYTVAGKTGTSQKVDPKTGTYGDEYVASFIGFAPASDPKYLTLIVVDEPNLPWGETVAAPAFQQVMRFTLGYFNVPPDLTPAENKRIEKQAAAGGHH